MPQLIGYVSINNAAERGGIVTLLEVGLASGSSGDAVVNVPAPANVT
jgi:hypothetical protein